MILDLLKGNLWKYRTPIAADIDLSMNQSERKTNNERRKTVLSWLWLDKKNGAVFTDLSQRAVVQKQGYHKISRLKPHCFFYSLFI